MNVLISGYTGLLGRHIARMLKDEGHSIRVIMHKTTVSRREFIKEADEVFWGSLDNPDLIREALKNIHVVVHCAWKFSSPLDERPTINEIGTRSFFQESIRAGVLAFAFISSVAVYGMGKMRNVHINELSPLANEEKMPFVYPSEKISSEIFLNSFERKNTKLAIFRPGPIFSEDKSLIKKNIRIFGISFGIGFGNGKNRMPFIHVDDVSSAVLNWIKEGKDNQVFNVTPTKCLTYREWYRNWARLQRKKIKIVFLSTGLIRLIFLSTKVLKKILGRSSYEDINYVIACATRNLLYSNEALKKKLVWNDEKTTNYTNLK